MHRLGNGSEDQVVARPSPLGQSKKRALNDENRPERGGSDRLGATASTASGDIDVVTPEEVYALPRAVDNEQARRSSSSPLSLRLGKLRALRWRDVDFARAVFACALPAADGAPTTPKSESCGRCRSSSGRAATKQAERSNARRPARGGPSVRGVTDRSARTRRRSRRARRRWYRRAARAAGASPSRRARRRRRGRGHRGARPGGTRVRTPARAASCSPARGCDGWSCWT